MITLFIISILLTFLYSLFIFSIYFGLKKLSDSKIKSSDKLPSVTLLIPFRNEEENIKKSIEAVNQIEYEIDKLEVIYINDSSNDSSIQIFDQTEKRDFIKLIHLQTDNQKSAGKKRGILFGIENSKNDIIVTTDADCFFEKDWLKNLISNFNEKTALVAGPVDLIVKPNFIGSFQRLEFAGLNLSAAGLIAINKPIICSGANLAYRKKVFIEVGGFGDTINYSSGDDDFLLQKIASLGKWNIKFAYSKSAKVFTNGKENLSGFVNQRARWASKGFRYESISTILLLIIIFLFYIMIPIQLILFFLGNSIIGISLIAAVFAKLLSEFLVMQKGLNDLYDKSLLRYFLTAEIFQIPYIIISPIIGIFGKFNWKGRNLNK